MMLSENDGDKAKKKLDDRSKANKIATLDTSPKYPE